MSHSFWVAQQDIYQTLNLFHFNFPVNSFFPFEVPDPYLLPLNSERHHKPHFAWLSFGISRSVWIPHRYPIKFDFLLLICLMSFWFSIWLEVLSRRQEILAPQQKYSQLARAKPCVFFKTPTNTGKKHMDKMPSWLDISAFNHQHNF